MPLVAGVDSSTQATKVVVRDADTGALVRQGRAPHPDGTEVDPAAWWSAFEVAIVGGLLEGVDAIAVAGQQHGMVALGDDGRPVRRALLWNDTRSAPQAAALTAELGGPAAWAEAVGLVPVASFTVTKLRWLAEHEPSHAARVAAVMLPHDWVSWRLRGGGPGVGVAGDRVGVEAVTDRGDASGTGYWSPRDGRYRADLLERALGHIPSVPRVAGVREQVGHTRAGAVVGPGTGDNMAAALALGAGPGDVVVSIGTSGVVSAVASAPVADPRGVVAGFADASGRYLPLVATLNASRVLDAACRLLGVDHARLDTLALDAPPGAGGLVLLPYLDGERTPNRPDATGVLRGLRTSTATPENLARAAVEGLLCSLADALAAVRAAGVPIERALLVGGGARSRAVRALAPSLLAVPVAVPSPGEYVADGAARQAAWTLRPGADPPPWALADPGPHREPDPAARAADVLAAYADLRDATAPR